MPDPIVTESDTVGIRYSGRQYRLTITKAARQAGVDDDSGLIFDPAAVDDVGLLPALVVPKRDAQEAEMGRNIAKRGREGVGLGVAIPKECLEALGYDLDAVRAASEEGTPMEITVLAGEGLLAFERPADVSVPESIVDKLEAEAKGEGGDE
jgi:hypothetical protein